MAGRGNPSVVRRTIGPGTLYAAALGTTEPAMIIPWPSWPAGWLPLGYTEEGSSFSYELSSEAVEVAEELDSIFNVTTGRNATVSFSSAEPTQQNLKMALNGGVSTIADPVSGAAVVFEPPDLGEEVRIMLGFQSETGDERWIWRQCFQTGNIEMSRAKGAQKTLVPMTFSLEKPETGKKLFSRGTVAALKGGA